MNSTECSNQSQESTTNSQSQSYGKSSDINPIQCALENYRVFILICLHYRKLATLMPKNGLTQNVRCLMSICVVVD